MAMYLALAGAASTALDLLSSLAASKSSSTKPGTGVVPSASNSFSVPGATAPTTTASASATWGRSGVLSTDTWNALTAAEPQAGTQQSLFARIDTNSDGAISQSEFREQLGAGGTNTAAADKVFAELDANGDGSVSAQELAAALQARKASRNDADIKGNDPAAAASTYNVMSRLTQGRLPTATNSATGAVQV